MRLWLPMSYWDNANMSAEVRATARKVLDLAFEMHTELGPGFLESIYHKCFVHRLRQEGITVDEERYLTVTYRGLVLKDVQKVDLFVLPGLCVELKAVDRLAPVHRAQLISYIKATGADAGLLINFNAASLRDGIDRCVHPKLLPKPLDDLVAQER